MNKTYIFEETIRYECGPAQAFQLGNGTTVQYFSSSCQWNQTWSETALPTCTCNCLFYVAL